MRVKSCPAWLQVIDEQDGAGSDASALNNLLLTTDLYSISQLLGNLNGMRAWQRI